MFMENKEKDMKKNLSLLFFTGLLLAFINLHADAMGLIYTNANYPVTATGATTKNLESLKEGKSSAINILGLVEFGDAGVNKATKEANIKKINFIDVNEKTYFLFFSRITTTVYGE